MKRPRMKGSQSGSPLPQLTAGGLTSASEPPSPHRLERESQSLAIKKAPPTR